MDTSFLVSERLVLSAQSVLLVATGAQHRIALVLAVVCPDSVDFDVAFVGVERQRVRTNPDYGACNDPSVCSDRKFDIKFQAYRRRGAMLGPAGDRRHEIRRMLRTTGSSIPEWDRGICEEGVGIAGM